MDILNLTLGQPHHSLEYSLAPSQPPDCTPVASHTPLFSLHNAMPNPFLSLPFHLTIQSKYNSW